MKKFLLASFVLLNFGIITGMAQTNAETIKEFLNGILSLENENVNAHAPLMSINTIAAKKASKTINVTKENISEALQEAKGYKYCIIIVGNQTIAKITEPNNTTMSGSWGTKMPMSAGYVQKGTLTPLNDYLNNIIGRPDDQVRTMYLFN